MGLLSHRVERSEIAAGDHIYTWRTALFAYSHHGIYVGESKVVHFTRGENIVSGDPILSSIPSKFSLASNTKVSASCTSVSSTCTVPDCGFQQKDSGVILSCLDCFLCGGRLYRFDYGVNTSVFLAKLRGGTCTTAQSDSPGEVIHRAMYLLQNGFGNYDVFENNCEDFALYCKTSLVVLDDQDAPGMSGQTASAISAPSAAIVALPLKLFMPNPAGLVLAITGMYCMTRYATDIGVRSDVTKVKVEELNRKGSKRTIEEKLCDTTRQESFNQTDAPANKRQKR